MNYKTVKVEEQRLNGLKLRAIMTKPKTNVMNLVDAIFENDKIPRISEQELKQKVKEIEN